MKKIVTSEQMRAADAQAITNEPVESIDLMERASSRFVTAFCELFDLSVKVLILAGPGNNGGDGLAIARLLNSKGFHVKVGMSSTSNLSADCEENLKRLSLPLDKISGSTINSNFDVLIDALFGSGLNRPLEGEFREIVELVNKSDVPVVSVDIPSGLMSDQVDLSAVCVQANYTLTFQRPKLTFFIPEIGKYCGEVTVLDIGLDESFIDALPSGFYLVEEVDVQIRPRDKFAHKGVYGHAQIFAGSQGKMGAAVLCANAALRSGVGLCTVHIPSRGEEILQSSLPEAMALLDLNEDYITSGEVLPKASAICVGPGIGTEKATSDWLSNFLSKNEKPLILDADALNIISQDQALLDLIHGRAILTPHLGELERLIGPSTHGLERIEKVKRLAEKHDLVILIKGAHSAIVSPNGDVYFNPTGNSGMATAGSGDVLSGIIVSFLAQGLSRRDALISAVYLHGSAGDIAKDAFGEVSLMASDLLKLLPKAISNVRYT